MIFPLKMQGAFGHGFRPRLISVFLQVLYMVPNVTSIPLRERLLRGLRSHLILSLKDMANQRGTRDVSLAGIVTGDMAAMS